jgi:torulene dioxygenase
VLNLLKLANVRELSSNPNAPIALDASARRFRLENIQSAAKGSDFAEAKVEFDYGVEKNMELPVVSPSVANRPYKYAYGIHTQSNDMPRSIANSIIKIDVTSGVTAVWIDERHVPGEPIFVPSPGGSREDAGVLLTVALDGNKGTSALIVIDAETMKEVARAEMKIPFPFGFHVSMVTLMLPIRS